MSRLNFLFFFFFSFHLQQAALVFTTVNMTQQSN